MNKTDVKQMVGRVAANFRTFGGGRGSQFNPIADALKDQKPTFAAGVDVEDVVRFILTWYTIEQVQIAKPIHCSCKKGKK